MKRLAIIRKKSPKTRLFKRKKSTCPQKRGGHHYSALPLKHGPRRSFGSKKLWELLHHVVIGNEILHLVFALITFLLGLWGVLIN